MAKMDDVFKTMILDLIKANVQAAAAIEISYFEIEQAVAQGIRKGNGQAVYCDLHLMPK